MYVASKVIKLSNLDNCLIASSFKLSLYTFKCNKVFNCESPVAAATGLSQLNTLLHLNVYNDNLNDEAIKQLSKLDNLITLDATYNKFTRASYELIRNMSVLGNPSNYYPKFKDL